MTLLAVVFRCRNSRNRIFLKSSLSACWLMSLFRELLPSPRRSTVANHFSIEGVLLGLAHRSWNRPLGVGALSVALLLSAASCWAQEYAISTLVGGAPLPTPAIATNSSLGQIQGVAADGVGN